MVQQKTVKTCVRFSGIGVHSGVASTVTIWPADVNNGIIFRSAANPAHQFKVGTVIPEQAMHATVIKANGWYVSTVEHLLASLRMLDIDNVVIEMQGNEVPILDGSALPFVQALVDGGFQDFAEPQKYITPLQPLRFDDGKGRVITIDPVKTSAKMEGMNPLSISYTVDFSHPLIGGGTFTGVVSSDFFIEQIAPARTFGFLEQLPFLRQHKLAQGSSLSNTVVIGEEILNDLRFPDECDRHKVLDLCGDLGLLPYRLTATVTACNTSHNFNRLVVEHYLKNPTEWLISSVE